MVVMQQTWVLLCFPRNSSILLEIPGPTPDTWSFWYEKGHSILIDSTYRSRFSWQSYGVVELGQGLYSIVEGPNFITVRMGIILFEVSVWLKIQFWE